jgi:hypothetical protein
LSLLLSPSSLPLSVSVSVLLSVSVLQITWLMLNSHFREFLNKEDFPEMARCLAEAHFEAVEKNIVHQK